MLKILPQIQTRRLCLYDVHDAVSPATDKLLILHMERKQLVSFMSINV
jgi:hypothetical protein